MAYLAAMEAGRDHHAYGTVELAPFAHQRVISKVLDFYRKEWRFGRRTARATTTVESKPDGSTLAGLEGMASVEPEPDEAAVRREVGLLVMGLPEPQRSLVVRLFWLGVTETQEARAAGVNQSTIHRRKAAVLEGLRSHFALKATTAAQPW